MALKVWLPLNGTLDNIGISDGTVSTTVTNIWNNNGKIGKCILSNAQASHTFPELTNVTNFSISYWIYIDSSAAISDWADIWGVYCTVGSTSTIIRDEFKNTLGTHQLLMGKDSTIGSNTNTYIGTGMSDSNAKDKWVHITLIKNNSTVNVYTNGILTNTINNSTFESSPSKLTGKIIIGNSSSTAAKLNDFRIYDHCLSPKEVKEISQGLVLHYKLDGWSGGVNQNLALDTVNKINTSTAATKTVALDYGLQSNFSLIRGKKITISADIILENAVSTATSGSKRVGFEPAIKYSDNTTQYMGYWIGLDSTPKTLSGRYSTTVTVQDKDFQSIVQNGIYIQNLTSGTVTIKNIKVELGDIATPWSPAPSDLGIDTTKIIDSSGYGHDGTILSNPYTNSDADRYQISTYFDGVDDGILIENLTLSSIINDQVSYSFWIKPNGENGARSVYFGSYSSTSWSIEKTAGNVLRLYWNGSPDETCSVATITDGIWQHIVVTKSGTNNIKVYINGVQKWTSTAAHNTLSFPTTYRIGRDTRSGDGTPYHGLMSDFRIYATALSEEDILDLYHTSANIDNLQNIHAFELKEQSGNMFAGSPMTGTVTWDATNNYYTITSNPSTSTCGIGPAVGTSPKKIIPWGMSYILTYEVYSPTAAQWYIDYNNNDPTTSLSGNDNDNGRLRTGVNVPANTWTLITYGCSNTNETKNPDHLPLYDYSTGLGPVMTNISSAITWHMRNPQWYLVDADNKEHVYENGVFQANFLKEDNQSSYTSFRNEEKAAWAHGYIEK